MFLLGGVGHVTKSGTSIITLLMPSQTIGLTTEQDLLKSHELSSLQESVKLDS